MGLGNKGRQKEAGGIGRLALLCSTNPRGGSQGWNTQTPMVDAEWLPWVESFEGPCWGLPGSNLCLRNFQILQGSAFFMAHQRQGE